MCIRWATQRGLPFTSITICRAITGVSLTPENLFILRKEIRAHRKIGISRPAWLLIQHWGNWEPERLASTRCEHSEPTGRTSLFTNTLRWDLRASTAWLSGSSSITFSIDTRLQIRFRVLGPTLVKCLELPGILGRDSLKPASAGKAM